MIFMAASMEKTMRKKYSSFSCGGKWFVFVYHSPLGLGVG